VGCPPIVAVGVTGAPLEFLLPRRARKGGLGSQKARRRSRSAVGTTRRVSGEDDSLPLSSIGAYPEEEELNRLERTPDVCLEVGGVGASLEGPGGVWNDVPVDGDWAPGAGAPSPRGEGEGGVMSLPFGVVAEEVGMAGEACDPSGAGGVELKAASGDGGEVQIIPSSSSTVSNLTTSSLSGVASRG
jgi:hypothetical protein